MLSSDKQNTASLSTDDRPEYMCLNNDCDCECLLHCSFTNKGKNHGRVAKLTEYYVVNMPRHITSHVNSKWMKSFIWHIRGAKFQNEKKAQTIIKAFLLHRYSKDKTSNAIFNKNHNLYQMVTPLVCVWMGRYADPCN